MDPRSTGMRRYLYEHLFYKTVQETQAATGAVITISAARALRTKMEDRLQEHNLSMADPKLGVPPVLWAIDEAMSEVPGYKSTFKNEGTSSPAYNRMRVEFFDMAGIARKEGENTIQAKTGPAGARLPVTPYDPRWAVRSTVKGAGTKLTYLLDNEIEQFSKGSVNDLDKVRSEDLHLWTVDAEGKTSDAGPAMTMYDLSGVTELMGQMSKREYENVRGWVVDGARGADGNINLDRFMSAEALARSTAILNELREQGTPYTIKRDRNPGQIRAELTGSKISVRLTETRAMEHMVGRVYDGGISTYYSTNYQEDRSPKSMSYVPTPGEAVDLLRIAQGKPVQRADGKGLVGQVSSHAEMAWDKTEKKRKPIEVQDAYHSSTDKSVAFVMGDLKINGEIPEPGAKVLVRRSSKARTASSQFFLNAEKGEAYLREAIDSARDNVQVSLEVPRLVMDYEANAEAAQTGDWFPDFNGDAEIASIQRGYWDVLRGAQTTLLRPGATEEEYQEKVGVIGELQLDTEGQHLTHDMLVSGLAYGGSPEQKIRDHAADTLDNLVGSYELHEVFQADGSFNEQRFDPSRVSKYMTSEYGVWRNNADIVAALRATGMDGDELMGSGFSASSIKDRLITFDAASATSPLASADPFVQRMGTAVTDTIERNGGKVTSLLVDQQGIMSWEAERYGRTGKAEAFTGEIGQIFGQGPQGEVVTGFAGGENYMFVPGYEARITGQLPGENKSVEERTVLRGYEQSMVDAIEHQVAGDMLITRSHVGDPTSLNGVYRRLYDERHDVNFIENSREEGLGAEWVDAILATEARRVRYDSEIAGGSTIHAAWAAESGMDSDPANDNHFDAWVLTGARNMAIMTEVSDGYFDPVMTNGSVNQGITRYLVEGAQVGADGRIIPSADPNDRTPLMKHPDTEFMSYDPYDRQQMSASNLLNASAVTKPVGVAMMTFGGWTADDPMVVSKEFAEANGIRGSDGTMRKLVVGDKLSDLHGNKGVISLVVDREMDAELAQQQGLSEPVEWFKANPELDVVMSPFSAVSRFNGGTARELMSGEVSTLVAPDAAQSVTDGIGQMKLIVTHKDAESGTRVYDDEALAQGRGRKASSQLAWALGSQGCDKVMAEFYGPNNAAAVNFRELVVTMGLDMAPDGTLQMGYDDMQEGFERRLFEMPELVYTNGRQTKNGPLRAGLNTGQMKRDFGALIGDKGGDLELPFPLKFPTNTRLPQATDGSWKLPVMSSHLRTGQDMNDGSVTLHDYTNQYLTIHEMACRYRFAQEELKDPTLTDDQRKRSVDMVAEAPRRAQSAFSTITDDLKARRFAGKHNIFKEGLMASRLPNSATAVWTSDPRLDIDQVSMGPAMAESLGFKADDYAMVWRDPVLRDGGVRYLRVAIDERLTGVAINPVMDKSFDGDFDGDSVAVVRLTSDAAKAQAMETLTVEANLLDLGQMDDAGMYPLNMQDALDVKVAQHVNPELTERFEALRQAANDIHYDVVDGVADPVDALAFKKGLMNDLSDYYRDAQSGEYGNATLRFGDAQDHVKSVVEACIDTGAKGSMAKIKDYERHLGVDSVTGQDKGSSLHTRKEDQGVMMAVAVKSHGTGIAGTYSQRGVKALRGEQLKAVLELTYPVTQSILQSKHDPEEAQQKYNMIMGPARQLWKGRAMVATPGENGARNWEVARDDNNKEFQASPERWKEQFIELYTAKDGLNVSVNIENVDKVARALSKDGVMLDMEDQQVAIDIAPMGSTMDRLAYGGTFDDLVTAASNRENVFDGEQNGHFAPYAVRSNQKAEAAFEAAVEAGLDVELPETRALVNRDVLPDHDSLARARGTGRTSPLAQTVRAPKELRPRVSAYANHDFNTFEDVKSGDEDDYQMS